MKPKVSVCCIVYNHEKYLKDFIKGITIQKTNFPIEIIIHDDLSTDNSRNILSDFQQQSNLEIKLLFPNYNRYSRGERPFNFVFKEAQGKYLAVCEGDDYWTDPLKLQKQVDFLEENPEYGMSCTQIKQFNHQKDTFLENIWGSSEVSFQELLNQNQISTLTAVFKKELWKTYDSEVNPVEKRWKMGDYPQWLYFSLKSKIHFLPEVTGVYRILSESASHSKNIKKQEVFIKSFFDIKKFFLDFSKTPYNQEDLDDEILFHLATNALKMNNRKLASSYYSKVRNFNKTNKIKSIVCKSSLLTKLYQKVYP
ncbi:glycosyltransferase family 2 protein [Aureivirga sp. CE67]|uniref:glycosyltransferase family 2 protein n=1 Tax=Aureivirga sp. CE67 TaxID=1788983 RepID=UPI0018CBCE6F|nr:glycosyltransferase [Aureivirga sp. CE67]